MAEKKAEPAAHPSPARPDPSLGTLMAEARKRKGLTPEQVVSETRIPASYINMIEREDYALVADQIYVLPFVRRYAEFLGLDGEDVAMRFVREVQRAEISVQRISEPMTIAPKSSRRWRRVFVVILLLVAAALVADLAMRRLGPLADSTAGSALQSESAPP